MNSSPSSKGEIFPCAENQNKTYAPLNYHLDLQNTDLCSGVISFQGTGVENQLHTHGLLLSPQQFHASL